MAQTKKEEKFYPLTDKELKHGDAFKRQHWGAISKLADHDRETIDLLITCLSLVKHRKFQDAEKTIEHLFHWMISGVSK